MSSIRKERISYHGWLNIDKPVGVSSTYIVNLVKRTLNAKKLGHAGTLDPAASGILPIALGEATKTVELMQDADKEYIFTVRFGETTDSLDSEGTIIESGGRLPSLDEINKAIPNFIGSIRQFPPAFSAVKINGERAYDLARKGLEVKTKEREVNIYNLKLLDSIDIIYNNQSVKEASFICECSKGTYIRSLGADMAKYMKTIGYITLLRRTRVGSFKAETALNIEKKQEGLHLEENRVKESIEPIDIVLDDIPVLYLKGEECRKLRDGQKIPIDSKTNEVHRVYNENKLFALVHVENAQAKLWKVFNI